jgi:type I restriction enzyme S subunit
MEVKPGYKQTEVGVIPEDWKVSNLRTALANLIDNRGKTPPLSNEGYPLLEVNAIYGADKNPDFSKVTKYVSQDTYDHWFRDGHPKEGDILVATVGSVGASAIMADESGCIAQNIIGLRVSRSFNAGFVYYYTQTEVFKSQIRAVLMGAVQPSLKVPHLMGFLIPYPSEKDEQRAITGALGDVDALLGTQEKLIAKKRDLKLATMQQLLTGQKRLPGYTGEWEVKRLGEIGTFTKGKGIKKDEVVADGLPCIRYGEIYTHYNDYIRSFRSFISLKIARESQRLKKGDLLFAGSGETAEEIGKCVAFLGDEEAYAGGDIVILSPAGQNSMYLGYLMNHTSVIEQKARMGQGDAVVHISASNLGQLNLRLPLFDEQTAIATVLSDMDAEIGALEQRLAKTHALKQGMMQELLTGKTRLI